MIKTIKIYPPIGIARLGNSEDEYFIGPERPLDFSTPVGGYREAAGGKIKRQAARFRLFGFDEDGRLVGEVTADEADEITWTVHVANTKAAADRFFGRNEQNSGLRNAGIQDRAQLRLDPGPISVGGKNPGFTDLAQSRANGLAKEFMINQKFLDQDIRLTLGTATPDDQGRLLVLGGHGESKSPTDATLHDPGSNFANHDGWYDDVADGLVSATVRLKGGNAPPVTSAWVIVGPPKYAPGIHHVVSLYDTLLQRAVDDRLMSSPFADPTFKPSIATDILPLLVRVANVRWVYSGGSPQFDPTTSFHRTFRTLPPAARAAVFNRLSLAAQRPGDPAADGGDMPRMWSDLYPTGANGTLTRIQHKMMEMWKDGATVPGATPSPADPITPDGLTRAALEPCVGAAFYPGIEASWKLRDVDAFSEPFRLDSSKIQPGDITNQMSLPWQSDFLDCAVETATDTGEDLVWWPAQRPIDVLRPGSNTYVPWARTTADGTQHMTMEQMITGWAELGFLVANDARVEDSRT